MCADEPRSRRTFLRRPWFPPQPVEPVVVVKQTQDGPATSARAEEELDTDAAARRRRERMTWKEWVLYDFLRYWYWVGALALVAFFLMQVSWAYHVKDAAGLSGLALCAAFMVAVEFYVSKAIWPDGVLTEGWPAGRRVRRSLRRLRWRL